jgi:hypothetical protein
LLESRVRMPLRAWMFVSYAYMLCCPVQVCDGLITRPKESYRVLIRLRNLRCEAAKVLTRPVEPLMMMKLGYCDMMNCSSDGKRKNLFGEVTSKWLSGRPRRRWERGRTDIYCHKRLLAFKRKATTLQLNLWWLIISFRLSSSPHMSLA